MVRLPGTWKSFDDLEDSLTIDELILLMETFNEYISESRNFDAALQGVDLSKGESSSKFDEIVADVQEELTGMDSDMNSLSQVGIGFMEVD